MFLKNKASQENLHKDNSLKNLNNSVEMNKNKVKMTPEKPKEVKNEGDNNEKETVVKNKVRIDPIIRRAIEPSEFKINSEVYDSNSPTRRLLKQNKSRLQNNNSKNIKRNDSQSKLSVKKLSKNESLNELMNDQITSSLIQNEQTKSKKLIKNLKENIGQKLNENRLKLIV